MTQFSCSHTSESTFSADRPPVFRSLIDFGYRSATQSTGSGSPCRTAASANVRCDVAIASNAREATTRDAAAMLPAASARFPARPATTTAQTLTTSPPAAINTDASSIPSPYPPENTALAVDVDRSDNLDA